MTFSTLVSLGSVVIALVSLVVSIWKARNAKKALEQSRRFRADALKEATFAKVLEGLQEMMEVISKLMGERDSISSSIAGNDFRAASNKADPLLKELEALRWKWISLLPNRFIPSSTPPPPERLILNNYLRVIPNMVLLIVPLKGSAPFSADWITRRERDE